jgi:hypothetical protein
MTANTDFWVWMSVYLAVLTLVLIASATTDER